jgi:hypothetical protein
MIWEWEKVADRYRFAGLPSALPPTEDEIRQRAYYRSRVQPDLPAQEHWRAAEAELLKEREANLPFASSTLGGPGLPEPPVKPQGLIRSSIMPAVRAAGQKALETTGNVGRGALQTLGLKERTPEQMSAHWDRVIEQGRDLQFRDQARAEAFPSNTGLTPTNMSRGVQAFHESVSAPIGRGIAKVPGAIMGEGARTGRNFMQGWNWMRGLRR